MDESYDELAIIRPIKHTDAVTGDRITISVSPYYSTLTVNDRSYYFVRETGEFDGTSMPV